MSPIQLSVIDRPADARDIKDSGAVAIGAMTPSFPPAKVSPRQTNDGNKVRMGAMTPLLP